MIFLENLDSIIEATYLEDAISGKIGECNIFVNPDNIKFIASKTIIITIPDYSIDKILALVNNGCKVISRVKYDIPQVEFQPYILRLNYHIMWNGKVLTKYESGREILQSGQAEYRDDVLYFPQIYDKSINLVDKEDNLTSLGWALQQVGINVKTDTPFTNLDIIKTGKVVL